MFPMSFRPLLASLLFALVVHVDAQAGPVSPLEQLLLDKNYPAFQARAYKDAASGNAEANFLIGKAQHLGLGVPIDLYEAKEWYDKALALGSARAAHNMGIMALDQDNRKEAIASFKKALSMGFNNPTLFNLGRAYSPLRPRYPDQLEGTLVLSQEAADYFTQAYAIDKSAETAPRAGREYVQMIDCLRLQKEYGMPPGKYDRAALLKEAVHWLTIAMDANSANAMTNYGALMLLENKTQEARVAFLKGAAGGNALAHHHLGEMAEREGGAGAIKQALAYYKEAHRLGLAGALSDVERLKGQ
ncbi:hypothetical protein [Massilia sp. TWP1-3-3]|uniref:tetratricopeptide repeat protein n=1 Tax=Massilia sp. TWP1-3-3 TaxID=2804573 RepID=UPI003CFB4E5B